MKGERREGWGTVREGERERERCYLPLPSSLPGKV